MHACSQLDEATPPTVLWPQRRVRIHHIEDALL